MRTQNPPLAGFVFSLVHCIFMNSLARIFGSEARLKLLRLFVFNPESGFLLKEAADRTKLPQGAVRREVADLAKAGIIRGKRGKKKETTYGFNTSYEHSAALNAFIRDSCIIRPADILAELKKAGALKVVVLSGFFTSASEPQIDLLIAGDGLKERRVARAVAHLESELGREVRYALFPTADFTYRRGVYDRLIRDVLDYPHRTILDKIGL